MAPTKGDDKKKKSVNSATTPAKNVLLNEKESGLLMAIASALGDAPQVDYEAVNEIVGMTYTKNVKSAARKLFVKLGDSLTFSGNLNKHETTMLSAIAFTLGGAPGVDYDPIAQAVGMLHAKNAKSSAKTLFEKLAALEMPSTITFVKGSTNSFAGGPVGGAQTRSQSSAEDTEEGEVRQTPARATGNTPAKQNMSAKRGVGPRGSIKAALNAKSKKPSTNNNGRNSKGVFENTSANIFDDDDLYDDDSGRHLRTSDVQEREPATHGDDNGGDEDFYSVDQGSVGTLGGDSDQSAVRLSYGAEILEDEDDLEPGTSTPYGQEDEEFEEDGNENEPNTPYGELKNAFEQEDDYEPEPSAGFHSESASATAPQASMNKQVDLTNLAGIVKNVAEYQAMPPPPRPVAPRQQALEHNYMVQDPGASALVVTPFRHPPPGPIPGIYTIQVLGHLHPVTQSDVEMAAWYNLSIEVYMEWRIRNNVSAAHNSA